MHYSGSFLRCSPHIQCWAKHKYKHKALTRSHPRMDSLLRPENNYSHSGYSSYTQQSCYVDDDVVSGNRPDCQNGVPFGPTFLRYLLTDIDADCTIETPTHSAYIWMTLRFCKLLSVWICRSKTLDDYANFGQFVARFGVPYPVWVLYPPKLVCVIKPTPSPNIAQNITYIRLEVRQITPTTDYK